MLKNALTHARNVTVAAEVKIRLFQAVDGEVALLRNCCDQLHPDGHGIFKPVFHAVGITDGQIGLRKSRIEPNSFLESYPCLVILTLFQEIIADSELVL